MGNALPNPSYLLGANQRGPFEAIFDRFAIRSEPLANIVAASLTFELGFVARLQLWDK